MSICVYLWSLGITVAALDALLLFILGILFFIGANTIHDNYSGLQKSNKH